MVATSPYKSLLIYISIFITTMKQTTDFLKAVKTTETFETVERLPLSNKIENGFITVSDKGIVRFYSIFDNSENEIKNSLKRQQAEVENELNNTADPLYKEELEDLNIQLSNIVRKADKQESLREYWIKLNSIEELKQMVNEIVLANKKTIGWIVYLLGWPLEIDWNTIQKTETKYNWIRLFTKEKKDNPRKWIVKNKVSGETVSLKDYIEDPNYKAEDYDREPTEDQETEQEHLKEYFKKRAWL